VQKVSLSRSGGIFFALLQGFIPHILKNPKLLLLLACL
jgi:hypothetical protein